MSEKFWYGVVIGGWIAVGTGVSIMLITNYLFSKKTIWNWIYKGGERCK